MFAELRQRLAQRTPRAGSATGRALAAVAVILAPAPDSLLLIRRAEREGDRWSGQLAFPGGRAADSDRDLAETARRETREEVGIELADPPLGALDDLAPRTPVLPPVLVRPFVFTVRQRVIPVPNLEVAAAWWLPVSELLDRSRYGPVEFPRFGTLFRTQGYRLEYGILWGMSERILTSLLDLVH